MSEVLTHLWTSTLFLGVVLVLARVLPLTGRTRYALVFVGLLKFAIPAALITVPLRALGIDIDNLGTEAASGISAVLLSGPLTGGALIPRPASRWPELLAMLWLLPAIVLAIVWIVARRRLVSSALASSAAASPREHAALAAARRQLGLRASVDVRRSSICEAPAVVRIIRPVIVLPENGSDTLDDAELESLLRHECAHVARRDNLLGTIESALVATFWFHPLAWVAQRSMATAREQACDETAAVDADSLQTYISALTKICSAVLAPRLAGVSCMASARLKERMHHLMRYDFLRNRALSHRLVVGISTIAVLAVTLGSGLQAGDSSKSDNTPFKLTFQVLPGDARDTLEFAGRVVEASSGVLLSAPRVSFKRGSGATVRSTADEREIVINIRDLHDKVKAVLQVSQNGVVQQESTYFMVPKPDGPRDSAGRLYTGQPITLNLKNADIKDVLRTFSKLTGTDIAFSPSLTGTVTIDAQNMPWDQAFDLVLQQNNLSYEIKDNSIVVK